MQLTIGEYRSTTTVAPGVSNRLHGARLMASSVLSLRQDRNFTVSEHARRVLDWTLIDVGGEVRYLHINEYRNVAYDIHWRVDYSFDYDRLVPAQRGSIVSTSYRQHVVSIRFSN